MEKRNKRNLSRMMMIIAAFLLVTAIGVGVYAASLLTRNTGTNVKFTASLGVYMTVDAEQFNEYGNPIDSDTQLIFGGSKALDRAETETQNFSNTFHLTDDEYVLYTFTFKLNNTNYTDSDNVPYSIALDSTAGFNVSYTIDQDPSVIGLTATGTMRTTDITVIFKIAAPTPVTTLAIQATTLIFTATFGT